MSQPNNQNITDEFITSTFFPILRVGLGLSDEKINENIDFQLLFALGKSHAILPIIRKGLQVMDISGEWYDLIDQQCKHDIFRFVNHNIAFDLICNCFEQNSIFYVPLKGMVLRDLYPESWLRTSGDIDILIQQQDLDRAIKVLESETDFHFEKHSYHDVSMRMPYVQLELHFSIKEDMKNIDLLLSKVWHYVIFPENSYRCSFSNEYQMFHIIAHMAYHFMHGGIGVRSFIDLYLLRHQTQYDEDVLQNMCKQCGILKFYEECSNLSEVWFSSRTHSSTTKALEQFCIHGGVFGNSKNTHLSNHRNYRNVTFIFNRLFLSYDDFKQLYPNLAKHPILLPYYFFKRIFNTIRNIKTSKSSSAQSIADDIKSFDQLMKSVGM